MYYKKEQENHARRQCMTMLFLQTNKGADVFEKKKSRDSRRFCLIIYSGFPDSLTVGIMCLKILEIMQTKIVDSQRFTDMTWLFPNQKDYKRYWFLWNFLVIITRWFPFPSPVPNPENETRTHIWGTITYQFYHYNHNYNDTDT